MSSPLQPRGHLPARVYWIRRLVVLAVVVILVVVLAKLLGGSSDGASDSAGEGQAATVSSEASEKAAPTQEAGPRPEKKATQKTAPRLARPDGACEASDVLVKPVVAKTPEAGRDVRIRLRLRTREAEACTWQVSGDTVTIAITSGEDDIWTSRECPKVVPTEDVVVRRTTTTTVPVDWNARRSDDDCSQYTDWAMPGWYHVQTAAFGGESADVQFELVRPVSETITRTITPKPKPKPSESEESEESGSTEDSQQPSQESTEHRAGDDGGGNSDG